MWDFLTHPAFLWTVIVLAGLGVSLLIASYPIAASIVYKITLTRKSKDKWGRTISNDLIPEQRAMYDAGLKWAADNADKKTDLHIVNEGLNLYGEYYDFGFDKCAFILSGRTESLKYGYYFAKPYQENGFNVFVFDPRAHGDSDGCYNTAGFEEYKDDIAWVKHITKTFGVKTIVFHGICIGAAGGLYAIIDKNCPEEVKGIVTEGMFANFGESMKNHLRERNKPVFIMYDLINLNMKKHTGHDMNYGPIDLIDRLDKPLLMLHSKKDTYSTPDFANKLFEKAGCDKKQLVWFEKGRHSMLRITDTEKYDKAIADFIKDNGWN